MQLLRFPFDLAQFAMETSILIKTCTQKKSFQFKLKLSRGVFLKKKTYSYTCVKAKTKI